MQRSHLARFFCKLIGYMHLHCYDEAFDAVNHTILLQHFVYFIQVIGTSRETAD